MRTVAIQLARRQSGDEHVPVVICAIGGRIQADHAPCRCVIGIVEQQQFGSGGMLGEDAEIHSPMAGRCPQWGRNSRCRGMEETWMRWHAFELKHRHRTLSRNSILPHHIRHQWEIAARCARRAIEASVKTPGKAARSRYRTHTLQSFGRWRTSRSQLRSGWPCAPRRQGRRRD